LRLLTAGGGETCHATKARGVAGRGSGLVPVGGMVCVGREAEMERGRMERLRRMPGQVAP
jgi:hypothetical protein